MRRKIWGGQEPVLPNYYSPLATHHSLIASCNSLPFRLGKNLALPFPCPMSLVPL